jgi:hypothetical protein
LIDTYGYNKHHLSLQRRGGKDQEMANNQVVMANVDNVLLHASCVPLPPPNMKRAHPPIPPPNPSTTKHPPTSLYIKRLSEEEQKMNKKAMLDRENDLVFLSPLLPGYALKNKLWCEYLFLSIAASRH